MIEMYLGKAAEKRSSLPHTIETAARNFNALKRVIAAEHAQSSKSGVPLQR